MTEIVNRDGKRYLSTSVSLPVELVEQANTYRINRSGLLQNALKEEIARIEGENEESGHDLHNQPRTRTAHPNRRTKYESADC